MRNRGISKIYLIAGIIIGVVVLAWVVRIVAWNEGPGTTPGRSFDMPSESQTTDPFPKPDTANEPSKGPMQP